MESASEHEPTQTPSSLPFEREAADVLQEQRVALVDVLAQLRPPVTRPTDLHRLLSLNQKLSWRLFKAATAEDDRALAAFIPGRRPMERFFEAALRHGVASESIARARAAFARLEETVARHAGAAGRGTGGGSRDVFETMVADMQGEDSASLSAAAEVRHKRNMFRAASLLFGRQARASFGALIIHPSEAPNLVDSISIKGMIGLHKTRRGVPLHTMVHHLRIRMPADPKTHGVLEAIDPRESEPESVGLLRDFCSEPTPTFHPEPSEDGVRTLELIAGGNGGTDAVGACSEVTYFISHICRAAEVLPGSAPGAETALTKGYEMPVHVDIADVFMHDSIWDERLPQVRVYKWPTLGWGAQLRQSDLLPMVEQALHLGRGPYAGRTPHIPRYEEMMTYTMERVGWKPSEFRLFRCQVAYPVMHTRLRMVFSR